jgi:rod shape-determining protein MreB
MTSCSSASTRHLTLVHFGHSNSQRQWIGATSAGRRTSSRRRWSANPSFRHRRAGYRLSVDVCRPLQNGIIREGIDRSEEAVKEIIRHLIELAGPSAGQKINAVVGVPSDSLKINKLAIRKAVAEFVDSLVVVTEPFAVAYSLGLLNNALVIDIGAGTTDLCIMRDASGRGRPAHLLQAGDYVDDQLSPTPGPPPLDLQQEHGAPLEGQYSFVGDPPEIRSRCRSTASDAPRHHGGHEAPASIRRPSSRRHADDRPLRPEFRPRSARTSCSPAGAA